MEMKLLLHLYFIEGSDYKSALLLGNRLNDVSSVALKPLYTFGKISVNASKLDKNQGIFISQPTKVSAYFIVLLTIKKERSIFTVFITIWNDRNRPARILYSSGFRDIYTCTRRLMNFLHRVINN